MVADSSLFSPATLFARPIHFGVHNTHVSGKRIIAAKCLLLGTEMTPHFLLACVVDGIFMTGQIIRPGENRVAGLPSRRVDSLTAVGTSLRIA